MLLYYLTFSISIKVMNHEEKSFLNWMRTNDLIFNGEDYHLRFGIYLSNLRIINEHNFNKDTTFLLGSNQFIIYTPAEYNSLLGHKTISSNINQNLINFNFNSPNKLDWREKNIVNPIKNQGGCGGCWSFSVIQAQESKWALEKNQLLILSEQNLIDCVTVCNGCHGGDEYITFDYIIKNQNGYFMKDEDYPYKEIESKCKFDIKKGVCPIKSWFRPTQGDEEKLMEGCAKFGVVSIAIDASKFSFQTYLSGIYDEPKCKNEIYNLGHAVGLIGYGEENNIKYWLIRNSWGENWGEKGYMKMIRNKNNQCGVATDCVIPIL